MMRPFRLTALMLALVFSLDAAAYLARTGVGLLRYVESHFGPEGRQRLARWQGAEQAIAQQDAREAGTVLTAANALANEIPAASDQEHWRQGEYWATPAEFVASNGGDCEDYAIA